MQAAEELLALEAIFGADYTSERDGFRLRMLPNPGSLDTCYVSCELLARCACFRFAHAGQSVSMRCMLHAHIIPRQCTFLCQVQPLAKSSQHCPSCCVCSALTPCRHVLHCRPAPAAIPCFSTVKMHKLVSWHCSPAPAMQAAPWLSPPGADCPVGGCARPADGRHQAPPEGAEQCSCPGGARRHGLRVPAGHCVPGLPAYKERSWHCCKSNPGELLWGQQWASMACSFQLAMVAKEVPQAASASGGLTVWQHDVSAGSGPPSWPSCTRTHPWPRMRLMLPRTLS